MAGNLAIFIIPVLVAPVSSVAGAPELPCLRSLALRYPSPLNRPTKDGVESDKNITLSEVAFTLQIVAINPLGS